MQIAYLPRRLALLSAVAMATMAASVSGIPVPPEKPCSELTIDFSGLVDGSELIEITQAKAVWKHVNGQYPSAAAVVNQVKWNPRESAELPNEGATKFLDGRVDFSQARLEVLEGRDIIARRNAEDRIVVYVNDTAPGEGRYRFRITFGKPAGAIKPPPMAKAATLRIRARIDGSDVLHIMHGEARWEHKQWSWPTQVTVNDILWKPENQPILANKKETQFLPETVDFASAQATQVAGRDTAFVVANEKGVTVYFADNAVGADDYEVLITFGKKAADK